MSALDLDRLEQLLAAATPWPWGKGGSNSPADRDLSSALRNQAPALIARVRELEARTAVLGGEACLESRREGRDKCLACSVCCHEQAKRIADLEAKASVVAAYVKDQDKDVNDLVTANAKQAQRITDLQIYAQKRIAYLEQENAPMRKRIAAQEAALREIANDPHCVADQSLPFISERESGYRGGVEDGHRCAATKARAALGIK